MTYRIVEEKITEDHFYYLLAVDRDKSFYLSTPKECLIMTQHAV